MCLVCPIIYIKNKKLKIDLIGGTSDRSKIIRTYKVKVEGNRIHMLEEAAVTNELIYYIYELRNRWYGSVLNMMFLL